MIVFLVEFKILFLMEILDIIVVKLDFIIWIYGIFGILVFMIVVDFILEIIDVIKYLYFIVVKDIVLIVEVINIEIVIVVN